MKKQILLLIAIGAFLISGCSSMRVMVDYDDQFDFSNYKSFEFIVPQKEARQDMKNQAVISDPLFVKKASREITSALTTKGYRQAGDKKEADFLIAFYATAKNKPQITPPMYRIGRFGRRWVSPGRVYHYKQGTLIIDIVDRNQKELVWRGVGSGVLDRDEPTKNLLKAIEKILKDFPPKKK